MDKQRTLGLSGNPEPQGRYTRIKNGNPSPQSGYICPSTGHSGPQAGFPLPPVGFSDVDPARIPMQNQPVRYQPARPTGIPWMPVPPPLPYCPPGLECLIQLNQLLILQQVELLEVLVGFEVANKYEIKNNLGETVYFAVEDTDCCTRNLCGFYRCFTIKILDNAGQEVIILKRPLRCDNCFFPCCLQQIEIQAPPGVPIGYVIQTWHPCLPMFTIQNERKQEVLKIIGPYVVCSCGADIDFQILSLDEQTAVGKISKQWGGLVKELFTDTDKFGILFPIDLDVKMKAVMIGACFLIDFMFFERG